MKRVLSLIDPVDLTLPRLPEALEGMKIAHISDLHVRRPRKRYEQAAEALAATDIDLLVLTGDYMTFKGDEPPTVKVIGQLLEAVNPRYGSFGVFGNHDSDDLRKALAAMPVSWLADDIQRIDDLPIEILGFDNDRTRQPDAVATVTQKYDFPDHEAGDKPLRLLLSHKPTWLATAADMSVDIMFSGHTHGGQWRLPFKKALINSTDFPTRLSSGVLRLDDTLCVVTRGVGEVVLDFRIFCPAHIPIYTLRRGELPGENTSTIENVMPW